MFESQQNDESGVNSTKHFLHRGTSLPATCLRDEKRHKRENEEECKGNEEETDHSVNAK